MKNKIIIIIGIALLGFGLYQATRPVNGQIAEKCPACVCPEISIQGEIDRRIEIESNFTNKVFIKGEARDLDIQFDDGKGINILENQLITR